MPYTINQLSQRLSLERIDAAVEPARRLYSTSRASKHDTGPCVVNCGPRSDRVSNTDEAIELLQAWGAIPHGTGRWAYR